MQQFVIIYFNINKTDLEWQVVIFIILSQDEGHTDGIYRER